MADADRLLELSRQAQGELPEDSDERQRIVAAAELLGQLLLDAAPDSPESFLAILWPALPPGCPTRNWCPSAAVPRRVRAARRGVVDIAVYRLNGGLLSGRSKPFGGPVRLGGVVIFTVIPANLTLVAAKAGMTGGTGSGPSAGSAQAAGMVNSATAWLGQILTLSLLVSALLTKSLFPRGGFRPSF